MIMKESRDAVYLQVARKLRERFSGKFSGQKLPSFRAMAAEYGVSICAIQRAIGQLRADSTVRISHGRNGRAVLNAEAKSELRKFTFIHPYRHDGGFGRLMPCLMMNALDRNSCQAMLTVKSSGKDPAAERAIAENAEYNNVDGILLSPEGNFSNADYFRKLSEKIPVVLIDQAFPESGLPSNIVDYKNGGKNIGQTLKRRGSQKILVMLNSSNNGSVRDMINAIAEELTMEVVELPLFELFRTPSLWRSAIRQMEDTLKRFNPDAVFSPYANYLDLIYFNGVSETLRKGRISATVFNGISTLFTPAYYAEEVLEWSYSEEDLFEEAVRRLIRWRDTSRRPSGVKKILISPPAEIKKKKEPTHADIPQS